MCCPGSSFLWGLKEELDIPAVGDLGKVLLAMANVDEDFVRLLGYRFGREGTTLYNHPVRNVMLVALIDLKGSLTEASKYMSNIMKVKGSVLPLTEEKVELDSEAVSDLGTEIIADDICVGADGRIRHNELKTAYRVFSYLMRDQ